MEKFILIFENGDHIGITAEDYAHAWWRAEEYENDYDTKIKCIHYA